MQGMQTLVFVLVVGLLFAMVAVAGQGSASDAQRACAAQHRAQYSDEMNRVELIVAGFVAAEACTP